MLLRKPPTKKEKRKATKKRLGLWLIIIGLFLICISLAGIKFLTHDPIFLSPLSQNQDSLMSRLTSDLKDKGIEYQEIVTNDDLTVTVKLKDNQEVIIDTKKSLSGQLSSLQLIVSQLKIEGKTFRRLDFRYQKPVITL